MGTQKTIDILSYDDHRTFLRTALSQRKSRNSNLGLRSFAKKAGFNSASTVSMIINGKRKLTLSAAEKIAKGLSLTGRRKRYLLTLARLDLAKSNEELASAREQLLRLKSVVEEAQLELRQYRFLTVWYYPAIYVLAGSHYFNDDPDQIAHRLGRGVTASQVVTAVNDMVHLGLLKKEDTYLIQTQGPISTADEIKNAAIYQYHRQMITLGLEALELPLTLREMNGLTVAVTPQQLAVVKDKIRKFRKELNEYLSQGEQSGEVYQLNIQFFPLTQTHKTQEESK